MMLSAAVMQVLDPWGRADLQEIGGEYIESTEEYLIRIGHMMDHAPTQVWSRR